MSYNSVTEPLQSESIDDTAVELDGVNDLKRF